ncbi:MAG: MFS transporter [Azonexus sp.]|nr:MFS transporter [Azonexus sp.]
MKQPDTRRLIFRLFLPFAAGYFLSYLYRTANAVLGPVIARELALSDSALGLLTSVYFLAFGTAQLPLGVALDRFGPRRVEAALLLVAASGAVIFALADDLTGLTLGRALIGLGVAACLMASFKAFSQWFAPEQQAALTGWVMAAGGLGALIAAKPLELMLGLTGWRGIALILAALTVAVALLLWRLAPDKPSESQRGSPRQQGAGLRDIFSSRHFWVYAPVGFCFTGGFMAIQGLWVARWLNVIENLDGPAIATRLTGIGLAMLGGFLFMGFFATTLTRRGVSLEKLYRAAMTLAFSAFALICAYPGLAGAWLWPILGACFSLSNIAYSLVAKAFPPALSGRANTALNLFVFAGAFGLQWGIGVLVDLLRSNGWAVTTAYRATFFTLLGAQLLALGWLLLAARRR